MPGLLRFIFAQQHLTQKAAVANPGERPIASASSFQEIRLACFRAMIFSASNGLFIAIPSFGGNHAERTRQDFMRILIS